MGVIPTYTKEDKPSLTPRTKGIFDSGKFDVNVFDADNDGEIYTKESKPTTSYTKESKT